MPIPITIKTVHELALDIVSKARRRGFPTEASGTVTSLIEQGIKIGMARERQNVGEALQQWRATYAEKAAASRKSGNLAEAQHIDSKAEAVGEIIASITPAAPRTSKSKYAPVREPPAVDRPPRRETMTA